MKLQLNTFSISMKLHLCMMANCIKLLFHAVVNNQMTKMRGIEYYVIFLILRFLLKNSKIKSGYIAVSELSCCSVVRACLSYNFTPITKISDLLLPHIYLQREVKTCLFRITCQIISRVRQANFPISYCNKTKSSISIVSMFFI